ncbi:MAG TPA: YkvA family protein [Bacteroidota bacterium]|nr:YkvA family protein [Candidatus Kapabacteria bacterium]HRS01784.1 YkvA family protein [Bacteroidota bacterium]
MQNSNINELESTNQKTISEKSLFSKIKSVLYTAGQGLIEKVLLLYYVFKDSDTPQEVKLAIIGALTYFILPFDAIPDFFGSLGLSDDLSVIMAVLVLATKNIKPEHRKLAKEKLSSIFGN